VNQAVGRTDLGSARDVLVTFLPALAAGQPPRRQATLALALLARGGRWGDGFTIAACEVGQHAARRLGLGDDVAHALGHVFDLWRDAGGSLPLPARIARTTGVAVLLESLGGVDTALDGVRRRSGGMLDPDVCAAFVPAAPGWFSELARTELTSAALGAEPEPRLATTDLPAVATVLADLADLQSPFLAGHSRTVSALAAEAAGRLGLPAAVRSDVALAGLVHDVGRVAVSAGIWARGDRLDTDA
jgi:hypothetical protein